MNKDHAESLSHYLEHYGGVSPSLASASPQLTSFATPSMTIMYGPAHARREWKYEFKPPMYAGEARKRLEAMHQDARRGLGISPVEIDRVVIGFGGVVSVVVCTAVVLLFLLPPPAAVASAFAFQAQYMSVLLRALGVQRPADPDKTGRAISLLWSGVLLGAHVAEARFCTLPLFKTYSVRRRSVRVTYALRDKGQEEEEKLSKAQ
ncbi:hypothetical protein JCM8202v2_002208 [Rhodotorula sphaerocarpa]